MAFVETKVYFDGSHYIAIPHTTRNTKRRASEPEDEITIVEEKVIEENEYEETEMVSNGPCEEDVAPKKTEIRKVVTSKTVTKKEYFEELYRQYWNLSKRERRKLLIEKMLSYFDNEEQCTNYVDKNIERKDRNMIARRTRMFRKSNLQDFNYFCTFTYDGAKHSEYSFRKGLSNCLSKFSSRKGWKYIGAWERSPDKNRLHFHAIMDIPEGTMPGYLAEVNDYSFSTKRRQITKQNTYFNDKYGRTDFEEIDDKEKVANAIFYLLKYIDKSGEKLVYSKGLPQFFISDIMNDDVVCRIGNEDKKLLLFDDFDCWDEGEYIGKVSKETIRKLRTAN